MRIPDPFYRHEEAVPDLRQRFYKPRILGGIFEGLPQFLYGRIDPVLEVYKRVLWPERGAQLLASDDPPFRLQKQP
jgi:hypothetical protein